MAYPMDLDAEIDTDPRLVDKMANIAAAKAKMEAVDVFVFGGDDLIASCLWGVVLWFGVLNDIFFARASRPSDLVLPALGRLMGYSSEKDQWLADFENGSRGEYPAPVLAAGAALFFVAGAVVDQGIKRVVGADSATLSIQTGIIGTIWAGVYEIGRLETGFSLNSREEDAERTRIWEEFNEFAEDRLERTEDGGSVNQVYVIAAFRRFHSRHRIEDYPGSASDKVIVEMFKRWYQVGYGVVDAGYGPGGVKLTSSAAPSPTPSGFYKQVKIKAGGRGSSSVF